VRRGDEWEKEGMNELIAYKFESMDVNMDVDADVKERVSE